MSCSQPYRKFEPANPPPPLMTGEPGSFAHETMALRVPAIAQNLLADHATVYPPAICQAVQALHDEIRPGRPLRPLRTNAPDRASWAVAWRAHRGKTWFEIPWYFAEAFFYRRLLEATGYFGRWGAKWQRLDPFLPRKQTELEQEPTWQALAAALADAADYSLAHGHALLHHALWGNRSDLCFTALVPGILRYPIHLAKEQSNLLVDESEAALAHLFAANTGKIEFICDNAGVELLLDLVLTDFLLRFNQATQITMHVKAHPTFVSDTTPADIELTLAALAARAEGVDLAGRLACYRRRHRLLIQADLFWNSSRFFWELPPPLEAQLAQAELVIIKGDANYRRLLGDSCCWPAGLSLAEAVPYFPASFVALRTLKSGPIVGLAPGQAEALDEQDPTWRVNGRWGVIQFRQFRVG